MCVCVCFNYYFRFYLLFNIITIGFITFQRNVIFISFHHSFYVVIVKGDPHIHAQ